MKVSVIVIDYKKENPLLIKCLDALQKQTCKDFEILLLTDHENKLKYPKLRKKSYGRYVGPAQKRDDGAKMARGEILAFIDDDAYPCEDWLENLVVDFKDPKVIAVSGPGVTPPDSSLWEQASGWASASPLGGGPYSYRFLPCKKIKVDNAHHIKKMGTLCRNCKITCKKFPVDDYPSMNFAVRRKEFLDVGGFDSNYWPGEDTKLCLDLVLKTGKVIIYDPKILVYHHRRPLFRPHLRQNGNYGLHRGHFARVLPQTSLRLSYFCPTFLVFGLIFLFPIAFPLYSFMLLTNAAWVFRKSQSLPNAVVSIPAVFLTHSWYGIRFMQGFLSRQKIENSNQK